MAQAMPDADDAAARFLPDVENGKRKDDCGAFVSQRDRTRYQDSLIINKKGSIKPFFQLNTVLA